MSNDTKHFLSLLRDAVVIVETSDDADEHPEFLRKARDVVADKFRWRDGHTYWLNDGNLIGAPTYADGSIDWENAMDVRDFDMKLNDHQRAEIAEGIRKAVIRRMEGGAK